MIFLPIVQRELRAAARQRSTYRTRTWYALITSLLAGGLLLLEDPASAKGRGSAVFAVLSSIAFGFCLLAGIRHAADCLSEEKREGTLGLLFLTDLKAYDIVAGKLAAISIRTFQGLFAFFPVLATGLVLGGITAGEFWRMAAVLTSTLFVSLSAGLWVSSRSRTTGRAMAATFGLVGVISIVPLAAHWLVVWNIFGAAGRFLSAFSPMTAATLAWDLAYQSSPRSFWSALVLSDGLGWVFLLLASIALPGSWQDRPAPPTVTKVLANRLDADHGQRQQRQRRLDDNPILWLALRHRRQRLWIGVFATACAFGGFVVLILSRWLGGYALGISATLNLVLTIALKLWVAWQACSTLAEARRTGAVELLLATPLKVQEIIHGHWQALIRFFGWPVVAALLLRCITTIDMLIHQPVVPRNWVGFTGPAMTLFSLATLVFDLIALAWVGMWMGLSQPKSIQAFARTVLLGMILPAVVFCLPNVLFDLFWIQWARRKLEHEFRRAAADRFSPIPAQATVSPNGLTSNDVPPVITHPKVP